MLPGYRRDTQGFRLVRSLTEAEARAAEKVAAVSAHGRAVSAAIDATGSLLAVGGDATCVVI